jgi:hypothetical protein
MLNYVGYLLLITMIYKLYPLFSKTIVMYKTYRSVIDPNNQSSVFSSAFSFVKTLFNTACGNDYTIEKFNRDYIKIKYNYKNKPYYYLLKVKRGVTPLLKLTDENGNDILDVIAPYLGPNLDCHGVLLTPNDFGYKKITATTVFDNTSIFDENDNIVF